MSIPNTPAFWNQLAQRQHPETELIPERWELCQYPGIGPGVEILGNIENLDVLELGCGDGSNLIALSRHGAKCVGVDFAAEQVNRAKQHIGVGSIHWVKSEAADFLTEQPNYCWDFIVSIFGALEFSNPSRILPQVRRVLKPGGALVFTTADSHWLWQRNLVPELMDSELPWPHRAITGLAAWTAILHEQQMQIVWHQGIGPTEQVSAHIIWAERGGKPP
ncbi:class I SAM-dependent methyltransferase [Haloglycomyces albus]|uniref:class I SAM-dependent methyltransferase n=1 Tax=Haloglycomyces albus TaxID=526067 RepID=UPI00046CD987|nr:class I SAM-dependent methyltransferase [Haloglycomyces albus]